jgi:dihydropyrimidinase
VLAPYYPGAPEDLGRLDGQGHRSLKLFMCLAEFDRHFDDYRRAVRAAAAQGTMVLIHCEDAGVIHQCTAALMARGCGLQHFAESRPPAAEVSAIHRAIALGEETGAMIYIVHLSCAEALSACVQARARGVPIFVEARPLYLHLTDERYRGPDAGLYVGQPPLRSAADREALWEGLRAGTIDTLGSDHAPFTAAQKLDARHTLADLRPGVAELETMLPLLFSRGLDERRVPLERLVALTASNPARLFGLYPRKGTIAVGSDADLVLWDLQATRTIDGRSMRSRAGYSPYDGMTASAWPRITLRRGEVVFEDGQILGRPGQGQLLARGRSSTPI